MRLKKQEREFFLKSAPRKLIVKNPQFKQREVIDHFVKEGIAYNALNPRKNGQSLLCDTHLDPPSSWTSWPGLTFL